VGLQWGDEGKGKVVDYVADSYAAVVRYNGGSNAGHTVVVGGTKHTFHLLPSGALKGKELLIGAGVAVDPVVLSEELSSLPRQGGGKLLVDTRCSLVSPFDKEFDGILEESRGESSIGTTRRGIGPSYAMRALRLSPRICDLLRGFDFAPLVSFYKKFGIEPGPLASWVEESKGLLGTLAGDVSGRLQELQDGGERMLFESSQGTLLDFLHGSYPYVTSTHTLATYAAVGLGVPSELTGEAMGVTKCYTTRVGGGPFPSEIKDPTADVIRSVGREYGATTGRPRRVGWLDLVALRYATRINGVKQIALTKLDVLAQATENKVCTAYNIQGSEISDFHRSLPHLAEATPVWEEPFTLVGANFDGTLPRAGARLIEYIEEELKVKVVLVSYGEERSKTLEL